ncbi:hypothetical protein Hanom_Chr12g01177141 [Helianthus anomalus]
MSGRKKRDVMNKIWSPTVGANEETRYHRPDDWTALSVRVKNHTFFFLLNLDVQWRRQESGDVEMTGRGRGNNPLFPATKVWWLHILCHNNEVNTSLYRRYVSPLTSMGQT